MRKILIVAPFTVLADEKGFNRFTYLAENLSKRGHDVTLVTSSFRHADKQRRVCVERNLSYHLVFLEEPGYQKNFGIDRIVSHGVFEYNLYKYMRNHGAQFEVFYAAYPLIGAAYLVGRYAKKNNKPFILDIQDVWPEAVKVALNIPEMILDFALFPCALWANNTYKLADYVLAVSNTYLRRVESVHQNAKDYLPVYIGTDLRYFDQCNANSTLGKPKGEFWAIYIGTLSHSYDIKTVIKAVALLKKKGYENIRFKVLGTGPMLASLKEYAVKENAPADFLGLESYSTMVQYLMKSDVAINALVAKTHGSITNKVGDFLAAGLPILNSSLNEEFCGIVKNCEVGINYMPGDYQRLAELILFEFNNPTLRKEQAAKSRQVAERLFDRRETYKQIYEMIEKAISSLQEQLA